MRTRYFIFLITMFYCFIQCSSQARNSKEATEEFIPFDTLAKTIHVHVALCDNTYQGIVPVPEKIGNGQDPMNNLYWGCPYGIRTYFKKSSEWIFVKSSKINSTILERIVFKHATKDYYLIADAYNGKEIKKCTVNFLSGCAGLKQDTIHVKNRVIGIGGNASLLSYIGHDGLMDFQIDESFNKKDNKVRSCIILACISKSYFSPHLKNTGAIPLVWTTGLMCPEAYTLHDALTGYVNDESNEAIRSRAAQAYSKYQKCSEKAARGLLVTGW